MKAVVTAGLTPVGPLLQAFFIDYLYGQKRASTQTVESYRDTFRLLLRFLQQTTGKAPSALHTPRSDPSWPTAESLEKLNQEVGGNLIRVQSPLAACASGSNGASCQEVIKNLQNPY